MKRLEILLVEDSPSDVRLIREALREATVNAQVTVARDGVEGLEYLRRSERGLTPFPDLIFLDLNLPRKNGLEVLAEVKSSERLRHIPILVMSSSSAEEDISAAYELHANCFITKPADLDDYVDMIRSVEKFWFFTVKLPPTGRETPRLGGNPCERSIPA